MVLTRLRSAIALAVFRALRHDPRVGRGDSLSPEESAREKAFWAAMFGANRRPPPLAVQVNVYGKPFPRDAFELEMQMFELRGAARVKLSTLLSHARLWTDTRGVRIKALRMTAAELADAMLTGFVHFNSRGPHVAGIRIEIKR